MDINDKYINNEDDELEPADEKKETYVNDAMLSKKNTLKALLIIGGCVIALAIVSAVAICIHLG